MTSNPVTDPSRTLMVLDIDGTLLQSIASHQRSYQVVLRQWGLDADPQALNGHLHHTDSWIFREIYRARRGVAPSRSEEDRFSAGLTAEFERLSSQGPLEEVEGAAAFLRRLDTSGYAVAFATGGVAGVTTLKLSFFDPWVRRLPVATASDHAMRHHIVQEAVHRSRDFYGHGFDRVVCVGDGLWDALAASAAGAEFVGLGSSDAFSRAWAGVSTVRRLDEIDLRRSHVARPVGHRYPSVEFRPAPRCRCLGEAPATRPG